MATSCKYLAFCAFIGPHLISIWQVIAEHLCVAAHMFFHLCFVVCSIIVIFYSVSLALFLNLGLDFAGFFSVDGMRTSGCLSYGFGIALAAFIINILATIAGLVAICYKKMCPARYKYTFVKKLK